MKRYFGLIVEAALWFIVIFSLIMGMFLYKHVKLKEKHSYHVFFSDTNGIRNGSPVKTMGNEIGYVSNVKVINSDEIFVSFVLTNSDISLPAGTLAKVESTGLVGSRSLELYPPKNKPLRSDELLLPVNSGRVQGAFENSSRIAQILYNASSNINKSLAVGQIPIVRELVHKTYLQSENISPQLDKINKQQGEVLDFIENNEHIDKLNEKMEKLAR